MIAEPAPSPVTSPDNAFNAALSISNFAHGAKMCAGMPLRISPRSDSSSTILLSGTLFSMLLSGTLFSMLLSASLF